MQRACVCTFCVLMNDLTLVARFPVDIVEKVEGKRKETWRYFLAVFWNLSQEMKIQNLLAVTSCALYLL